MQVTVKLQIWYDKIKNDWMYDTANQRNVPQSSESNNLSGKNHLHKW